MRGSRWELSGSLFIASYLVMMFVLGGRSFDERGARVPPLRGFRLPSVVFGVLLGVHRSLFTVLLASRWVTSEVAARQSSPFAASSSVVNVMSWMGGG